MTELPTRLEQLKAALADRYHLERVLGEGGMATVYLAQDLRYGRPVALKVLEPELAAALGAQRFLNEIQVTANLQHPHILPLYDSGSADGALFYVMPVVHDESLRDRLAREKLLPVDETIRITRQVASALDFGIGPKGGGARPRVLLSRHGGRVGQPGGRQVPRGHPAPEEGQGDGRAALRDRISCLRVRCRRWARLLGTGARGEFPDDRVAWARRHVRSAPLGAAVHRADEEVEPRRVNRAGDCRRQGASNKG
jgi:Protein kinase domain